MQRGFNFQVALRAVVPCLCPIAVRCPPVVNGSIFLSRLRPNNSRTEASRAPEIYVDALLAALESNFPPSAGFNGV